ncbi:hypothetical protein ACFXJ8_07985 [Nonomuraea sp. NPDC059194]|uniref:hypothetical protein n=1 Tax=Nonomuraea sp. NPDC059194 TaxID=3346764 RepID=UPI00368F94BD
MPIDQKAVLTGVSHGGSALFRRIAERGNDIVHWADHESPSGLFFSMVRQVRSTGPAWALTGRTGGSG